MPKESGMWTLLRRYIIISSSLCRHNIITGTITTGNNFIQALLPEAQALKNTVNLIHLYNELENSKF